MNDPIDNIEWLDVAELQPNGWNPNVVHNAELKLLELSIIETGWVQPVLVSRDMLIIDGFHRYSLSRDSAALREKYDGKLPCAVLDLSPGEAMMLTVRINRAKGTHVAVRMADLVQQVIDEHGFTREAVAMKIGATLAEVDVLYQNSIFERKDLKNHRYSQAWVPAIERGDDNEDA